MLSSAIFFWGDNYLLIECGDMSLLEKEHPLQAPDFSEIYGW